MKKKLSILILSALLCVSLIGGCSKKFSESGVTFDGEYIRWTDVSGTDHYNLSIDGGAEIEVNNNEYRYEPEDSFTVKITAVPKSGFLSKEKSVEKQFTKIDRVENVMFEDGLIKWDASEGAERYKVQVNSETLSDDVRVTSLALPAKYTGSLSIKVMALKEGTAHFSKWSDALTITVLTAPTELAYDGKTLTWKASPAAASYELIINGQTYQVGSAVSYAYNAGGANFKVKIRAAGNLQSAVYPSAFSNEEEYFYLAPITAFTVEEGILKWSPVENATGYKVREGETGQFTQITSNSYDKLESGKTYKIYIYPYMSGKNYFSQWDEIPSVTILRTPSVNYDYNSGQLEWGYIDAASGYKITVKRGNQEVLSETAQGGTGSAVTYKFDETQFDTIGDYKITMQALTMADSFYSSKLSSEITVRRLAPATAKTILDNPNQPSATKITVNSEFAGSTGFELVSNDVEISTTNKREFVLGLGKTNVPITENQTFNFKIYTLGGADETNKIYSLKSLTSLDFTLTRLAAPSNVSARENNVGWKAVTGAAAYIVNVDGNENTFVEPTATEYRVFDLAAGEHTIRIRAKGNVDNGTISSSLSNELTVTKLSTPTNITISNRTLSWGQVSKSSGYTVNIGNDKKPATSNSFNIVDSDIPTSSTAINVYALGNDEDIIDSDSSAAKIVTRFAAPGKPSVSGGNVIWNKPSNAASYTVTYQILKNGAGIENGTTTANSWGGGNFTPGYYAIAVKALGNGVDTFDSELSTSENIRKLEKPVIEIAADGINFAWTEISFAQGYVYTVGSGAWQSNGTNLTVNPKNLLTATGAAKFYLQALGNDAANILDSDKAEYSLTVAKLTKPNNILYSYDNDEDELTVTADNYTFKEKPEPVTVGFNFTFGGVGNLQTSNVYKYSVGGPKTLNIKVCATGNYFSANGASYYINSDFSDEKSLTFLDAPASLQNIKLSTGKWNITWAAVTGTSSYYYEIKVYDASGGILQTFSAQTSAREYELDPAAGAYRVEVSVYAVGNKTDKFDSQKTEIDFYIN